MRILRNVRDAHLVTVTNEDGGEETLMEVTNFGTIYVRKAYTDLYDKYFKESPRRHIMVTGNPGTGKTVFSYYVVHRLLCDNPQSSIVYGSHESERMFYISSEEVKCYSADDLDRNFAFYMFDCGKGNRMEIRLPRVAEKGSFIFTSPSRDNYIEYHKKYLLSSDAIGYCVYMPIWSLEEVSFCNAHIYAMDDDKVMERFAVWGGISRRIFASYDLMSEDHGERELKGVVSRTNVQNAIAIATDPFACDFEVSHTILHLNVDASDYSKPSVTFASRFVHRAVYQKVAQDNLSTVFKIMDKCSTSTTLRGIYGQLFESYCHDMLGCGKAFPVKSLENARAKEKDLDLPQCVPVTFRDLSKMNIEKNKLYIPKQKNFESVDSILAPNMAFQITVAEEHAVKVNGLNRVKEALRCQELNLYFVVPKAIYSEYKKQPYHTKTGATYKPHVSGIRQWVLCVDFPHSIQTELS